MQPHSAKRSRKAVKLSPSLLQDLAAYALAAGAAGAPLLALNQTAQAEIVYTPTRIILNHGQKTEIDFNNDGVADAVVWEVRSHISFTKPSNAVYAEALGPSGGIRSDGDLDKFASAMSFGQPLGSTTRFAPKCVLENVSRFGQYYSGTWVYFPVEARYLGVRFQISGEIHYGWARINTSGVFAKDNVVVLITGYAYETQPNRGLRAGDTGQGNTKVDGADEIGPVSLGVQEPATLGTLALGASGLSRWRTAGQ